jgi:adenosylcobinamide-phosphate synthase
LDSGGMSGAALLAGYAADLAAGDPSRWHPVAGFGTAASTLEQAAYAPTRTRGMLVSGVLVIAAAAGAEALARRSRPVALTAVTWAALGGRSLRREALHLADLIERGDLAAARIALRALCGRDAEALDAAGLSRAVVESVAENTSDAVVGALVWGALGGPGGVAAYRAANTLDAMFGHRSERYAEFGWFAAKLDDAMNWPAARLSAALTCAAAGAVGGSPGATLATVWRDGAAHPSPNAGLIEAAFAGALQVRLGGPLAYAAQVESRPRLGAGRAPVETDIRRATRLSLVVSIAAALTCAAFRAGVSR